MTIHDESMRHHAAAIRSQAVWAAIAAGLMLFFSFGQHYKGLVLATQVFEYTLKVGGIAMAISAVLLFVGRPFSLLFDGVVCIVIGGCLALSGLLMFVEMRGVDFQGLLNFVFGYMFVGSGRQTLTLWKNLSRTRTRFDVDDAPAAAPTAYLTSELLERRFDDGLDPPSASEDDEHTVSEGDEHAVLEDEPTDAPEGFLASFADPPDEEKPR